MIDVSDTIDGIAVCGMCEGTLLTRRYVLVEVDQSISVLCSETCFREARSDQRAERWVARRRYAKRLTIGAIFVGALLTPHEGPSRPAAPMQARRAAALPAAARDSRPPPMPPGWYGPEWPPSEMTLLATLGRDAWVHPMAGPVRRMPIADSRVFGAGRPGNRPEECRNGHCGVDLGGEIWGEHVHAVHDGVVDWVQRGANAKRGGQFVRLAHHSGTVFTQYFHLAAIPRGLERGVAVRSGDVVGLLGDTGVSESAPHLHFALSIRPSKESLEKYVDPEPLIALWPLRIPLDGSEAGLVTTVAQVGVPLGSAPLKPGRKARAAKAAKTKRGRSQPARGESDTSAKEAPAAEEDEAPTEPVIPEPSPDE
jgi:murein DD-endopeptidase MepM/ murein hydrolase activator NlpD